MSVVLPEPLGPIMASKLPSRTCRLRLRSACTRSLFSRYSTLMFSSWIMARDSRCNGGSAKRQNQSTPDGSAVTTSLRAHRYLLDTDVSILIGCAHGDKMQACGERADFDLERFFAVVEHAVLRGKKLPLTAVHRVFEVANQAEIVTGHSLEDPASCIIRELLHLRARVGKECRSR